jgi:hypothetical protein
VFGGAGVIVRGRLRLNDFGSITGNSAGRRGGGVWLWGYGERVLIGLTCGPGGNVSGNAPDDCYFEEPSW